MTEGMVLDMARHALTITLQLSLPVLVFSLAGRCFGAFGKNVARAQHENTGQSILEHFLYDMLMCRMQEAVEQTNGDAFHLQGA